MVFQSTDVRKPLRTVTLRPRGEPLSRPRKRQVLKLNLVLFIFNIIPSLTLAHKRISSAKEVKI